MKKLLLCLPLFYEYHSLIASHLEKKGYSVDIILYPHTFLYKLLDQIAPGSSLFSRYEQYCFQKLKKKVGNDYDTVLIIKGSMIPIWFLEYIKEKNKTARFVQYLWDDIDIDKKSVDTFKYFDKVCSFNPYDSRKYGLFFRPFFFANDGIKQDRKKRISILFIVSYRKERFVLAKRILSYAKQNNLNVKIILRTSIFLFLTDIVHHLPYVKLFKSKGVSYRGMMELLSESYCSIELPALSQVGLTTRPFEALGTRTKIITTNKDIVNYDFYNPTNVLVIDDHSFDIDPEWFEKPYVNVPTNITNKYTIDTFIEDILS